MSRIQKTVSPVDGSVFVERPLADDALIDATLERARRAQSDWQRRPLAERKQLASAFVDAFVAQRDAIAEELTWQMGRPIRFAAGEVAGLEERARTMIELADEGLAPIRTRDKPGFDRWIQREPHGVVFVIAPWNYPYLTAVNTVVPALLAGNTVILKHSAQTPLCAERFAQAFGEAGLPEGVFQYLHLSHADAERIIADPRIDLLAFTGSVEGGHAVEQAAAGRFIGVGLELGGKDPAYVRADADIDQAVETVMDGAFFNSGQSCCGIERIYLHRDIYDDFVPRAVEWVRQLRLGRPNDTETTLGPVVRASAADFVRDQAAEAIAQGATPMIDATTYPLDRRGSPYLAPQVLLDVDHSMRVMTEESFGPIVGIQRVESDEEAVALMNDSRYGLTGAIFTRDYDRGVALGQQLDVGTFFVNRCDYLDPELAWVGVKDSGRGCTLSVIGYEQLTRPKSFHIKHIEEAS